MVTLTRSLPVNQPGQAPLTRGQLWQALLLKVEDATLFVPGMTSCRVLERRGNEVFREIVWRGQPRRQRVTLHPEHTVEFEHLSENARGKVVNQIEEDADGTLRLRFTFLLDAIAGIAPGSAEEQAYGAHERRLPGRRPGDPGDGPPAHGERTACRGGTLSRVSQSARRRAFTGKNPVSPRSASSGSAWTPYRRARGESRRPARPARAA